MRYSIYIDPLKMFTKTDLRLKLHIVLFLQESESAHGSSGCPGYPVFFQVTLTVAH